MDTTENPDREERDIARLLQAAGPRERIPDELKLSWESRFRQELQAVTSKRKLRRRRLVAGIAASITVCAVALSLLVRPPAPVAPFMRISAVTGVSQMVTQAGKSVDLAAGLDIQPGAAIRTGEDGRVAVAYAGYDLRLDAGSRVEFQNTQVTLHEGQLYASDDEDRIGQTQLHIVTPHGEVRDIGTQFTVSVGREGTVATVRRGTILLDTGSTEFQTEARAGSATRVTVDRAGQVHTDEVAATGVEWQWIYDVSPGLQLEGKSAYEFLQWSVGESGRELEFASASAELYARRTVLHGAVAGLDPEQAVNPVLGATDLVAQLRGDTLLVSLQQ